MAHRGGLVVVVATTCRRTAQQQNRRLKTGAVPTERHFEGDGSYGGTAATCGCSEAGACQGKWGAGVVATGAELISVLWH